MIVAEVIVSGSFVSRCSHPRHAVPAEARGNLLALGNHALVDFLDHASERRLALNPAVWSPCAAQRHLIWGILKLGRRILGRGRPVSGAKRGANAQFFAGTSDARQRSVIGEILLCGTGSSNERHLMRYAEHYLRRELRCQGIRSSADPYSRRGECRSDEQARDVEVALQDWQHLSVNLLHFDRLFESVHGEFRLVLWTTDWLEGVQAAYELLNRYQRLLPLPADPSAIPGLALVLAAHRRLYPLYDPRERAQHERALDTWRWTLRTGVRASLGLQLAALFQHIDAHAQSELLLASGGAPSRRGRVGSANVARSALARLGFETGDLDHMVELILGRDETRAHLDLARLRDADDLSFFGTQSWHFLELYGHEATRRHIAQLFSRMSDAAICLALMTRQSPAISRMIDEALDATIPPSGVRSSLVK